MKKKAVIIIPARKGSNRIKNKNITNVCSKPLISYTIENALTSQFSNDIFISTDCDEIKKICNNYPIFIINRPKKLSSDIATSESVLIHALDEIKKINKEDPDFTILLQCTSPIRKIGDIDQAFKKIKNLKGDSLISVTKSKKFLWKFKKNKFQSINYDFKKRKREQDFEEQYEENGSIYITKSKLLRKEKNRLCGKIIPFVMDPFSSVQIDEKEDLKLAKLIMSNMKIKLKFKNIKLIVLDFDGVLTDDKVTLNELNQESVTLHRGDGLAISHLKDKGYKVIVLSSEKSNIAKMRCRKLEIDCYNNIKSKIDFLKNYIIKNEFKRSETLYVGNDINDLECMKFVEIPVSVANSHYEVLNNSKLILNTKGGEGAIRELLTFL